MSSIHTHILCFTKKTDSQRRHASIIHLGSLQESKRPVQSLWHWCCTCFKWHVLPYTALCSCLRQHSKVIKHWCHLKFGQPLFAHSPRICPSLLWKLSMLSIDEGRGETFTSDCFCTTSLRIARTIRIAPNSSRACWEPSTWTASMHRVSPKSAPAVYRSRVRQLAIEQHACPPKK